MILNVALPTNRPAPSFCFVLLLLNVPLRRIHHHTLKFPQIEYRTFVLELGKGRVESGKRVRKKEGTNERGIIKGYRSEVQEMNKCAIIMIEIKVLTLANLKVSGSFHKSNRLENLEKRF